MNLKTARILLVITASAVLAALAAVSVNLYVNYFSGDYLYNTAENIPVNKTGLVLGTSKKFADGSDNFFFYNRIDAAVDLYRKSKIKFIIVSGDNSEIWYNEPREMRKALVERGVPDSIIFQDHAGFRTLDAVVRAQKIFGQQSITIISQKFHNQRAVFIARKRGINAIAFNANDFGQQGQSFAVEIREYFAKVKAFLDVYIFDSQPKFLGEKIIIGQVREEDDF